MNDAIDTQNLTIEAYKDMLALINDGAASNEPTVHHQNIDHWLRRPMSANERAALALALPGKVIPCPCARCEAMRPAAPRILAEHMHTQMLRQYSETEAAGFHTLHVGRVRRAWRALCGLPARFEAWVDAADAERFFQRADAITNAVLVLIIALAVGSCFWGLISIILDGRPR